MASASELAILIQAQNNTASALKGVQADLKALKKSADQADASVGQFGKTMQTALGVAGGVLIRDAVRGLGGLASSVINTGLGFDALKEQATIAFTTMLGSGEKAKRFLDDLQAFAARTPFEFPDLITASQRLLAMGFNAQQIIPTLTAVGDAASGLGATPEVIDRITLALGQMLAKGKVSGEEMRQLAEAGIPAWQYIADAIGTSIPQAMDKAEKGTISASVAIKALVNGMEHDFGGMMAQQSKTFNGMLSTLRDTFSQAAGEVIEPFFNIAKMQMQSLIDKTGDSQMHDNIVSIQLAFLNVAVAIETAINDLALFGSKLEDIAGKLTGPLGKLLHVADVGAGSLALGPLGGFNALSDLFGGPSISGSDIIRKLFGIGTGGGGSGSGPLAGLLSDTQAEINRIKAEQARDKNPFFHILDVFKDFQGKAEDAGKSVFDFGQGAGDAADKLKTLADRISDAQNAIFGSGTKEEQAAQLKLAQINRQLISSPGNKSLEQQRDVIQKQIDIMQADNKVQELRIGLADKSLLSEKQQNSMVELLIDKQRLWSSSLDASTSRVADFADALGVLPAQIQALASGGRTPVGFNAATGETFQLPSYDLGTPYVPADGLAMLHRGERVLTAADNRNYSQTRRVIGTYIEKQVIVNGSRDNDLALARL